MAQTEHLGLHQWETTDSFLRTDFNEDFAKIDAAVGTMEGHLAAVPVEKIASVSLAEKSSQMELDLSGIDLSRYTCLRLVWYGVGTARSTVCMRVNGLTGNIYYSQTVGSSSAQNDGNYLYLGALSEADYGGRGGGFADFFPSCTALGGALFYTTRPYYGSDHFAVDGIALEELDSIQIYLSSGGELKAGSRAALYGLK